MRLTTKAVAASLGVGTHASTFGGNPVAAAAAVAVMETMLADGFFEGVAERSRYFVFRLQDVAGRYPSLATGVRGRGMLLGLVLTEKGIGHGADIVARLFERGILINFAGMRVLRFIPPLTVSEGEIDQLIDQLQKVLSEIS